MRPRVFVSSSIEDLGEVRDGLCATIEELDYEPVLSEKGGVGYLPHTTTEDSCYRTVHDCDVVVAVIGRRYGSIGKDNRSITHNEVNTARELGKPVYCYVHHDVFMQLRMFDENPEMKMNRFDSPQELSDFVREVASAATSNAVLEYNNVAEAKASLKRQLALYFGDLMRSRNKTVETTLAELLQEAGKKFEIV